MGQLHSSRIGQHLTDAFSTLVDMSDVKDPKDSGNWTSQLLTRTLAAYSLHRASRISLEASAQCITDGFQDMGIDAVHYDRTGTTLYLVQSKWHDAGRKGFDVGGTHKFISGVKSILNDNLRDANDKLKSMSGDIHDAVRDPKVKLNLIATSNSENPFSDEVKSVFDLFTSELNGQGTELVHLDRINQAKIYNSLLDRDSDIDLEVTMLEWGGIQDPYTGFYGQIELDQILKWRKHGERLFDKNLRIFGGTNTDVYRSVSNTLLNESEHLWYFNNGATVLCDSIAKAALYGNSREKGVFHCKGISVVNGAQTIGTIWESASDAIALDPRARIHLRIISLEECPEGFASLVTKATNTQNRIQTQDFVALDENQWRLASEFKLDGKRYVYRSGESHPSGNDGCHIDEATPALACKHSLKLAVQAKREVGLLWETEKDMYRAIFTDGLSVNSAWRSVIALRAVESALKSASTKKIARGDLVVAHGNRFLLYRVFADPEFKGFEDPKRPPTEIEDLAKRIALRELMKTAKCIEQQFPGSYLQTVFKNHSKCKEIDDLLGHGNGDSNLPTNPENTQQTFSGFDA